LFYITFQDFISQFDTVWRCYNPEICVETAALKYFNGQVYVSYPETEKGDGFTYRGTWVPGDQRSDAGGSPLNPS